MPNVPALYRPPGLPQVASRTKALSEAMRLTGSAQSWSMSYGPEFASSGGPGALPAMDGPLDATESMAFALWNEGHREEAIAFLERRIAAERESGNAYVPPVAAARRRLPLIPLGIAACALMMAVAGGSVLWKNWSGAVSYFEAAVIPAVQSASAADELEGGRNAGAPENIGAMTTASVQSGPAAGESGLVSMADAGGAEVVTARAGEGVPAAAPAIEGAAFMSGEGTTVKPEMAQDEFAGDPDEVQVALQTSDAGTRADEAPADGPPPEFVEEEPSIVSPEPAATATLPQEASEDPRVATGTVSDTESDVAVYPDESREAAGQTPLLTDLAGQTQTVNEDDTAVNPSIVEARVPRPRPAATPVIAEPPARTRTQRRVVVAEAVQEPRVPAPARQPVAPWELQEMSPELAYNRAMAEQYAQRRRAVAIWGQPRPVYVEPAPDYRRLEIIGRVPGW